jgi:energy-coupling factor transport system substrate-specific component
MKEILSPFKQRQTLMQAGLCALVFIGMAVPFKVMVLVEGFTEVRPVNAVPVVVGLLFGPSGAWGCAAGNLIADFFGTFSKASILGFLGNFFAAYLPFKLWYIWKIEEKPNVKSYQSIGLFILLSAISSLAVAIFIACGLDVFLQFWLRKIFYIIFFNNLGFSLFLALPVFIVLTSDDHKIEPYMPRDNTKYRKERKALLWVLVASQIAILVMLIMGFSMSEFLPMSIAGIFFLLSLLGFIVL